MNRFLFHVVPILILLLALGVESLVRHSRGWYRLSSGKETLLGATVLLIGIWPLFHADKREVAHMALYESHLINAHEALALSLKGANVPPNLRTLALGDAGLIPYLSDWTCIDFIGLNDEEVAHSSADGSRYIAETRPTLLVLYSQDGKSPTPYQFGFEPGPMLPEYEPAGFIKWFPDYYLAVYARKDIPVEVMSELSNLISRVAGQADLANALPANRRSLLLHFRERLTGIGQHSAS